MNFKINYFLFKLFGNFQWNELLLSSHPAVHLGFDRVTIVAIEKYTLPPPVFRRRRRRRRNTGEEPDQTTHGIK